MDLNTAVKERRSIRKFKKEAVPEGIIRGILDDARWSPSWGNTQPWEFYVITGEALEKFKEANRQRTVDGVAPSPDIQMPLEWPARLKDRYMGIGKSALTALNIAREDKDARFRYNCDMFYLFDAPCLVVAVMDKAVTSEYALLDFGLIIQTICLLAHGKGLGTCIMACSIGHADLLRSLAKIPEDRTIIMGVAMGYPDGDAPINKFARERAPVGEIVKWVK